MARGTRPSRSGVTRPGKGRSGVFRGDAGRQRVEKELERQAERKAQRQQRGNQPFRVWVRPGTTKEVIVLDDKPDWYMYEHNMRDPQTGRWNIFTGCITEDNNCPVCESTGNSGYFCLVLSVIDLEPYTTRDGKTIQWSRKLMVVKTSQIKKFTRKFDREGSLRGAVFELSRDGDKEPAIGNDIELVEFVSEDDLQEYKRSWTDRDGKAHNEDCSVPYNYEELFEEPTYESLAKAVGVSGSLPGSKDEADEELGEDGDWDEEEEEEEKPRRRPGRTTRRAVEVDEDEEEVEEPEEEQEEEDEPPARRRPRGTGEGRRSARPSRRRG